MFPCHYKQFLGVSCPMCGFQRALIELFKGNVWESITMFPALIPLILTLFVFLFSLYFKGSKLKKLGMYLLAIDLVIMVATSIYNNLNLGA